MSAPWDDEEPKSLGDLADNVLLTGAALKDGMKVRYAMKYPMATVVEIERATDWAMHCLEVMLEVQVESGLEPPPDSGDNIGRWDHD